MRKGRRKYGLIQYIDILKKSVKLLKQLILMLFVRIYPGLIISVIAIRLFMAPVWLGVVIFFVVSGMWTSMLKKGDKI